MSESPNQETEERSQRRRAIAERIGPGSMALVAGAAWGGASGPFRQSNEFYYLVQNETPQAYLTIEGESGETTLYLPHHDPARARSEGTLAYAEAAGPIAGSTGVDAVRPVEDLGRELGRRLLRPGKEVIYTPFAPGETRSSSRDGLLMAQAEWASDPWDSANHREARLIGHLRERFPQAEIRDLSPTLDGMRLQKSPIEIAHLRRAGQFSARGVLAAMRATAPGVNEYQLAALADLVFKVNGAQGSGYSAIVAGGANAWMGHYWRLSDALADGDLVLMDYAPDVAYYTSDIGRVWPVGGKFGELDRVAYGFVLAYYRATLAALRAGRSDDEVHDEVAGIMEPVLDRTDFGTEGRHSAALGMLDFRGHLSHPVGMAVHDVGDYRKKPMQPGLVISVDPMMWIEDEHGYIRIEDTVVVTEDGYENFTEDAPVEIEVIESEVGIHAGRTIDWYRVDS